MGSLCRLGVYLSEDGMNCFVPLSFSKTGKTLSELFVLFSVSKGAYSYDGVKIKSRASAENGDLPATDDLIRFCLCIFFVIINIISFILLIYLKFNIST